MMRLPARVLLIPLAAALVVGCAARQVAGMDPISNTTMSACENFVVAFSDEFDSSKFDLEGRSFALCLVGLTTKTTNGKSYQVYEFKFKGALIVYRDGSPTFGNIFMSLSHPIGGSHGSWGARVIMFDPAGTIVPIGRASLSEV